MEVNPFAKTSGSEILHAEGALGRGSQDGRHPFAACTPFEENGKARTTLTPAGVTGSQSLCLTHPNLRLLDGQEVNVFSCAHVYA
jgi:hypothetical protein